MSTASTRSRGINRRVNSLQNDSRHQRSLSHSQKRILSPPDVYSYALRVAYLAYLLQPRARRTQVVSHPQAHIRRSSTSFQDLIGDFRLVRDSKTTRFPHGFVAELEKRLTGVLIGKERRKEYQDHVVIRTFAVFLNALKEQSFKKRMEKDRRVEDLVLIFFSSATKELAKGKDPGDDSWQLMVDRHVALFVRLISLILKDHDWAKDRPELMNRLTVLESKLLAHDQDLAESGESAKTIETIVPLSYDVKDMALVQLVARIFDVDPAQAQSDINRHKAEWTEKGALQDLKTYQAHMNLKTGKTLSRDDFETDEAYDLWKRGETPDLSQMMLAIIQSNPDLAKSTPAGARPQFNSHLSESDSTSSDLTRISSDRSNRTSYVFDQPIDLSSLSFTDPAGAPEESIFTFIPPEPRLFYRTVLAAALSNDLKNKEPQSLGTPGEGSTKLLSKQSTELLNELCLRWRVPASSRVVLYLDVIREKFVDQEINLNTLDSAFSIIKEPSMAEGKKRSSMLVSVIFNRNAWTIQDVNLMQQLLVALREALLRELYNVMMHCYDPKPVPIGPVMYILEHHIQQDPYFPENVEDQDQFSVYVYDGLMNKAKEAYQTLLDKEIPQNEESWRASHVVQLGESVLKLVQKIQKRYRNNPEIMGYASSALPLSGFFMCKFTSTYIC
jgi:hypothetical protein